MNNYSDTVEKIVENYMDGLTARLHPVPARERDEFLQEIRSHIFESFLESAEGQESDEVNRILAVLRKLGEPSEVVADRLSETMVKSGARRKFPLYIVAGMFLAVFGIPLGFGGVAVLAGILLALTGVVVSFYAAMAATFLAGGLLLILGLTRIYEPGVWDRLLANGIIQMEGPVAAILDQLTPLGQGTLMIALACVLVVLGMVMLWLGKYMTRGLRFLFTMVFDWVRRLSARARHRVLSRVAEPLQFNKVPGF